MNHFLIIWFFIAAITAALPIPFIKYYTQTSNVLWIIASAISYILLILSYSIILQDKNITIIYPILKVLSVMLVTIAGIILFNNGLDYKSFIGILFGIMSIYLLSSKISDKS